MSTLVTGTIKSNTSNPPLFQNTSGTEIGTLCRAWVNFDGVTTATIRASYNVSSITRNGSGDYTVNFTTAMADANYALLGSASNNDNGDNESYVVSPRSTSTFTTTQVQFFTVENTGASTIRQETPRIFIAIFR
jgi:hypothetical protein